MADSRTGRLVRNLEGAVYWAAASPVLARRRPPRATAPPAGAATGCSGASPGRRSELARNLGLFLADELSPAAAQQVTRKWFRLFSCKALDVKRLRNGARPLLLYASEVK